MTDTPEFVVVIHLINQGGQPLSQIVRVDSLEQAQAVLDQLNVPDEFVLMGQPAQENTLRLKRSLIVSAGIRRRTLRDVYD